MKNLQKRREFFELSDDIDTIKDFFELTKKTKNISIWAASQLKLSKNETDAYIKNNISQVVKTNEVHKMISRIERDLFNADIDIAKDQLIDALYKISETTSDIVTLSKKML